MEITTKEYKRLAVMTVTGRIDSATSAEFETAIQTVIEGGKRNIVLDMADVDFLSSSGLRVLVTTRKDLNKSGGRITLAQLSERVQETLAIAGLDVLFESFPDRESAIASY